jgi:hypothetical protein
MGLGAVRAAPRTAELERSQVRVQRHEGGHEGREHDKVCAAHSHDKRMILAITRTCAQSEL